MLLWQLMCMVYILSYSIQNMFLQFLGTKLQNTNSSYHVVLSYMGYKL